MGRPWGQAVGCSVFAEFGEEPVDLCGFEGHVDLDGGVAGDGGGDAAAAGFGVFGLLLRSGTARTSSSMLFEFAAFETDGGGFDGEGAGAEGLGFEAVAVELVGDVGEGDHLRGEEFDEEGHEEALALDLLGVALAEDLFEEDALVGDVLVDDPEAFFVDGEDEGVAELAEGLEGGEGVEGVGLSGRSFVGWTRSRRFRSRWGWSGRRRRSGRGMVGRWGRRGRRWGIVSAAWRARTAALQGSNGRRWLRAEEGCR